MADDVKIGIGGEDTGFSAALEGARAQAAEVAEQITASFESVQAMFEKVQATFLLFTAALAGGEAFKEMVGSTVEATVSSVALGKQLGISTTTASQLRVAFDATHVTQEQFSAANQKLTVTMNKDEGAIKALGVETRNTDGSLRNSLDVQLDVNEALSKVKAGMDRNVEGTKIYGKGWLDAAGTLRLTREAMEEAKEKADALGLTIGQEGKDQVEAYRKALVESHDVMEALGKVIADAVLPILTTMGNWWGNVGPRAVGIMRIAVDAIGVAFGALVDAGKALWNGLGEVFTAITGAIAGAFGQDSSSITAMDYFRSILKVVEVAFIGLSVGVKIAVELIVEMVERLAGEFKALAATSVALFNVLSGNGKWSDVTAAWDKGTKDIEARAQQHEDNIIKIAEDGQAKIMALLSDTQGQAPTTTPTADNQGGKDAETAEKMAKLMAELNAELAAKKAAWDTEQTAKGSFIQFSLAQEKAFWDDNLSRAAEGSAERVEIERNSNKLKSEMAKAAYADEIATLKESEAAFKNNLQAKLAIAQEVQAKIATAEGARSPAAAKAGAEVIAIERQINEQRIAIEEGYIKASDGLELSKIDTAQREAELQYQLGNTSASQLLNIERKLEDERYQLKVEALAKKIALLADDPDTNIVKIQALMAEKLALEEQYDAKVDQLRIKSIQDNNKEWKSMFTTMQSGFNTTIQNFMKGTATLGATIKGLFADIGKAVMDTLSNIAAKMLTNAIQAIALGKMQKLEEQNSNAVKAASAAWASAANIPYVGWILAPAAAAAAYTGVMAIAEHGYDIPAGLNPIVQTHAEEMILPAKHADVIRSMADNGGSKGGDRHIHLNVNAIDAASFAKSIKQSGGAVSMALRDLNSRNMFT